MTNGGWTSLSAFSTTSTGYSRNGIRTSNDLVTANSAAYTAIANLSTLQKVNYSVNFEGNLYNHTCNLVDGQFYGYLQGGVWGGIDHDWYGNNQFGINDDIVASCVGDNNTCSWIINQHPSWGYDNWCEPDTTECPVYGINNSGNCAYRVYVGDNYRTAGYGYYYIRNARVIYDVNIVNYSENRNTTTIIPDCSLTVKFLNSGTTVVHQPVTSQTSISSYSTQNLHLNGLGGIRKIETHTTCTGSGANLSSGGVQFTTAEVRFAGAVNQSVPLGTVTLAAYNNLKTTFKDCGSNDNCAIVNFGATVDVGSGKIWKMVRKNGNFEAWLDNATGLVWTTMLSCSQYLSEAKSQCTNLSPYGINGETSWLPTASQISTAVNNGVRNFLTSACTGGYWWASQGLPPYTASNSCHYYFGYYNTGPCIYRGESAWYTLGVNCVYNSLD
jgi:hypothetical protein